MKALGDNGCASVAICFERGVMYTWMLCTTCDVPGKVSCIKIARISRRKHAGVVDRPGGRSSARATTLLVPGR